MLAAGVDPLGDVLAAVRSLLAGFEVAGLDAHEAAQVVEQCAEGERLLAALRGFAAATLEDKALWRREGFRSVAAWMASKTGTAVGPAIATMEMVGLLSDLPVVAEAFRAGRLSEAQAREIAAVASEVPDAEEQLVEAAGKLTLRSLQEECRRVEAAAVDEDDRYRQVHRRRRIRAWVDRHNIGRLSARMTPDELARVMNEIDRRCGDIVAGAIRGRWFESWEAHRVDALVELALPDSDVPAGPASMVHVVVDYDALTRGHTVPGERCEIPGIGPIPVTLARWQRTASSRCSSPKGSTSQPWPTVATPFPPTCARRSTCAIPSACSGLRRPAKTPERPSQRLRADAGHQTRRPRPPLPIPPLPQDLLRLHLSRRSGHMAMDTT